MEGTHFRLYGCQVLRTTDLLHLCSHCRFGAGAKVVHFLGQVKPWNYTYDPETKSVKSESHDPTAMHPEFLSLWWDIFTTTVLPLLQHFGLVKDSCSQPNMVGSAHLPLPSGCSGLRSAVGAQASLVIVF
jgi:lipopolysaccharide biosynthesis glycosyltransferase